MAQQIAISALDGSGTFNAYLAQPAGTARGAVIVIQEIFGINAGIRKMCDDWAAAGYVALAPDLFWRQQPGFEADADDPRGFEKAFALMNGLDGDKAVADIEGTIRKGRELSGGGKTGVVGYCMGGRLAFLCATRTDADASVSYYGGGTDQCLGESHAIGQPLLMHLTTADEYIGPQAQAKIREALRDNRHVTICWYDDVGHGFARAYGGARNEEAARLADGRTRDFFATHLG